MKSETSSEQPIFMTEKECEQRFAWVYPRLEQAGQKLRQASRLRTYSTEKKPDGSIVTNIDVEHSEWWLQELASAFPGETLVSEENASTHTYSAGDKLVWYVDPIDGTKSFAEGSPDYYVLLSLTIDGVPAVGWLYQPESRCVLYGNNSGILRLYTSRESYRTYPGPYSWNNRLPLVVKGAAPLLRERLEQLTARAVRKTARKAHNIVSPLSASTCGYVSFRKTAFWDLAAPSAIMQAAGFKTGILSGGGEPLRYNNGSTISSRYYCLPGDTPQEVLEYISQV